ncbi:MAG TPA: IPT/TIG domain-containing protein, partial [Roseiflexaceae bacterium]|nr:IPT/TIG domain-containing protein [Roseiflexaceae bacterium]
PGTLAVVRVDSDYGRRGAPGANDHVFYTDEAGVVSTFNGNGNGYVAWSGGASAQISANATTWNAELRINASVVGGMNHVIGLAAEQAWVASNSDRYAWPQRSELANPSTWATTVLGDVSQISDVTPPSTPVGSGDTAITVNGSGFAAGATVQFNGTALATTVISATQLQATIPAASLATAGMVNITAVNPGLEAAPSNALPFSATNPLPQLTQAELNGTTLTLTGSSFAAGATVQFNGNDYPASGEGTQISATVSDADLVGSDGAPVTVFNPGPGGGVSNVVTLGDAPVANNRTLYLPLINSR